MFLDLREGLGCRDFGFEGLEFKFVGLFFVLGDRKSTRFGTQRLTGALTMS